MSPRAATIPGLLAPQSEADLQSQVMAYLNLIAGLHARRQNSGKVKTIHGSWVQLAPLGTPDIVGHMPDGRALYIELKKPGEKPHGPRDRERWKAQEDFIEEAARRNCVAFRARSLEDVARHIGEALRHA